MARGRAWRVAPVGESRAKAATVAETGRSDVAKELNTITLAVWGSDERGRPIHDVRSAYVERCWLPILGPSTLLFLRFAVRLLDLSPDGVELDTTDLARSLGLGGRNGDGAPFRRVIDRAADFRVLAVDT